MGRVWILEISFLDFWMLPWIGLCWQYCHEWRRWRGDCRWTASLPAVSHSACLWGPWQPLLPTLPRSLPGRPCAGPSQFPTRPWRRIRSSRLWQDQINPGPQWTPMPGNEIQHPKIRYSMTKFQLLIGIIMKMSTIYPCLCLWPCQVNVG